MMWSCAFQLLITYFMVDLQAGFMNFFIIEYGLASKCLISSIKLCCQVVWILHHCHPALLSVIFQCRVQLSQSYLVAQSRIPKWRLSFSLSSSYPSCFLLASSWELISFLHGCNGRSISALSPMACDLLCSQSLETVQQMKTINITSLVSPTSALTYWMLTR